MSGAGYIDRLSKALELGLVDRGSAALATVGHDDWCALLSGGACDCNPEVRIDTAEGPVWILLDGTLSTEKPK